MKAKIGLLGISVLSAAVSISPFAFAQEGPYGRTPVLTGSASTKGNSAEAARGDATSKVKEGNDYRKARAELKDSILTAKAKAALGKDKQTRHSAIQIATANGIVVLSGRVNSKAGADRAQEIVARLKGVKDVHNELMYPASGDERITHTEHESPMTTVPVSTKEQGNSGAEAARESTADATSKVKEGNDYRKARAELKDSILTAKAKAALGKDEQTRNSAIQIATANGIVVLNGRVDSKAGADRAQAIVAGLKGVKDVRNELTYRASSDDKATLPNANRQ